MDPKVLRETLETTLLQDDRFPQRFYERLFEAHPELRTLFHRNSPGAQRTMFAQKLTAIVDHVDDPTWMQAEMAVLAASHRGYGVTPEMYDWVGTALLDTLREACGESWSDTAEQSWRTAYSALAAAMLR